MLSVGKSIYMETISVNCDDASLNSELSSCETFGPPPLNDLCDWSMLVALYDCLVASFALKYAVELTSRISSKVNKLMISAIVSKYELGLRLPTV